MSFPTAVNSQITDAAAPGTDPPRQTIAIASPDPFADALALAARNAVATQQRQAATLLAITAACASTIIANSGIPQPQQTADAVAQAQQALTDASPPADEAHAEVRAAVRSAAASLQEAAEDFAAGLNAIGAPAMRTAIRSVELAATSACITRAIQVNASGEGAAEQVKLWTDLLHTVLESFNGWVDSIH
jgi:trehalose-6-phosphate synthase